MAERKLLKSITLEIKESVLDYLKINGKTPSNTPILYEAIGKKSYRQLEDIFIYLEEVENLLIREKEGRKHYWRVKDKNLVLDKISQKDAINLDYAIELNRKDFDKDTIRTLKKMFQSNSKTLLGKLSISEKLKDKKMSDIFNKLSDAIENRYYLELYFQNTKKPNFREVKPIRLVFLDNNWYVAFEYKDFIKNKKIFTFGRLAFISEITFLKNLKFSNKSTFQTKNINEYLIFLETIQNSMTLYGEDKKIAKLQAKSFIAKYFKKDMKKFLSSQRYIEELENGSVVFEVEYTQNLEILPFIQKWMPDLVILEPEGLKKAYREKLQIAMENNS